MSKVYLVGSRVNQGVYTWATETVYSTVNKALDAAHERIKLHLELYQEREIRNEGKVTVSAEHTSIIGRTQYIRSEIEIQFPNSRHNTKLHTFTVAIKEVNLD